MVVDQPHVCPDGRSCESDADCRSADSPRVDTCERTPEGSVGCNDGEVCVLTTVGVRRCVRAGCLPDDTGDVHCGVEACLPDPEDPATNVCWLGGTLDHGAPCTGDYECPLGAACNAAGVCAYACTTEGEPCPTLENHVCNDYVCSPREL